MAAGNFDRAAECFLEQMELGHRAEDVYQETHSLSGLGSVYRAKGQLQAGGFEPRKDGRLLE